MSDEWKIQLSVKNKVGDMVNIRANTAAEIDSIVEEATRYSGTFGNFFFTLGPERPTAPGPGIEAVTTMTDEQAVANIEKHLGPAATPAQVALLVKRFGKTEEEAQALTRAQAAAIIKEGNK